jgi:ThiF family
MTGKCQLRFARADYERLHAHLFPGDHDEHGAVLLAGITEKHGMPSFLVREMHLATEGIDYVEGKVGYRALNPSFIHKMITRARDQKLAYLAVHNHPSDRCVGFSRIDMDSHELGYPALLQIARGMPVGALVFGERSIQSDVWLKDGSRLSLDQATIIGQSIQTLYPSPRPSDETNDGAYERQLRMFGALGQKRLAECHVAILGLGGIGSLVAEMLSRLGVGGFTLIDDDVVEVSNLSRIVGADRTDAETATSKIDVAERVILQANPSANVMKIAGDIAKDSVAKTLSATDYMFLAADSMRARLVFNAVVHQYLIPGVQLGSKIRAGSEVDLLDVMSANRPVRPGLGCLWCNGLIDTQSLAKESKTENERKEQAYGVEEPNPSVITLNAVAASHAVNDFLLDFLGLRPDAGEIHYEHFHHLSRKRMLVEPRKDENCSECSPSEGRFALGNGSALPTIEG